MLDAISKSSSSIGQTICMPRHARMVADPKLPDCGPQRIYDGASLFVTNYLR
jgi:hypothetical protein